MSLFVAVAPTLVTWRVFPERTPWIVRTCPRCGVPTRFASSDRFRVNASGRKLDVWLVYRCSRCDLTWNLTVAERTTPEALGSVRLDAYHRNDRESAWRCAFDEALLRRAWARPEPPPFRVERDPLPEGAVAIRFEIPLPVRVRLERILAGELGISRAALARLVSADVPLRRPVRDGQVIVLGPRADRPSRRGQCEP